MTLINAAEAKWCSFPNVCLLFGIPLNLICSSLPGKIIYKVYTKYIIWVKKYNVPKQGKVNTILELKHDIELLEGTNVRAVASGKMEPTYYIPSSSCSVQLKPL